jgi:two-component system nitrogen regulation response regulator NtrX
MDENAFAVDGKTGFRRATAIGRGVEHSALFTRPCFPATIRIMRRNIVVLDAEEVVRKVVTSILEKAGYSVTATADLRSAIEICKTAPPELILTNVYLPGISGHEAMKLLKEYCPKVPVLMVSGLPDSAVIRDWLEQDGFDIFPKPFTSQTLLAKVEEVVSARGNGSSG